MTAGRRFSVNVVENGDSEVLLLKRSTASRYGPGLWGFPAGHLEEGETPEQCATRELIEEIGPDISVEFINRHEPVRDEIAGEIYEFHLFHLRWLGGEIRLNHEHTDYAWVSRDNYRRYPVMRGVDLDLRYLNVWPKEYLNPRNLATSLMAPGNQTISRDTASPGPSPRNPAIQS